MFGPKPNKQSPPFISGKKKKGQPGEGEYFVFVMVLLNISELVALLVRPSMTEM